MTTPTMIQHGEADVRVPISQGYEFYNALKVKGVRFQTLEAICRELACQPGDLLEFVDDLAAE